MKKARLSRAVLSCAALLSLYAAPARAAAVCPVPPGQYHYLYTDGNEAYFYNNTQTVRVDRAGNRIVQTGDFNVNVGGRLYQRQGKRFIFVNDNGTYKSTGGPIYYRASADKQAIVAATPAGVQYKDDYGAYTKQADGRVLFAPRIVLGDLVVPVSDCPSTAQATTTTTTTTTVTTEAAPASLQVIRQDTNLIANMDTDVLFDFDSAAILPRSEGALTQLADLVRKERQGFVIVRGHTDSAGTPSYNKDLSVRRAQAVASWLESRAGVPATTLVTQGLGEDFPVSANSNADGSDNAEGRSLNRRVEVIVQTVANAPIPEPAVTQSAYVNGMTVLSNGNGRATILSNGNVVDVNRLNAQKATLRAGAATIDVQQDGDTKTVTLPSGVQIKRSVTGDRSVTIPNLVIRQQGQ